MAPEMNDIIEKLTEDIRQKKAKEQREEEEQLIHSFMIKHRKKFTTTLVDVFSSDLMSMTEEDMLEAMEKLKRKGYNNFLFLKYEGVKKLDHGLTSSREFIFTTLSISKKELKKQKVPSSAYMQPGELGIENIEEYEEWYPKDFINHKMEARKVLFDPEAMPIFAEIDKEGEWFKEVQVKLEEMYGEGISKVYSHKEIEAIQDPFDFT